jgi:hypothetical protein
MGIRVLCDARRISVAFEEYLPYVIVAVGAVVVTAFTMYIMLGRKKDTESILPKRSTESASAPKSRWPFTTEHTISTEEATKAREKLRTLELEREILSGAIRRLYEAQVEGKITEQERDTLAEGYKTRMLNVKDALSKNQSVVALQELEAMQEDLVKLFDDRFDELNMKIEEMRPKVQIEPEREEVPEIPVTIEATEEEEEITEAPATGAESRPTRTRERKPKQKTPATPGKTEAEKRIDQIRAEVEKVLERLGQMEVET